MFWFIQYLASASLPLQPFSFKLYGCNSTWYNQAWYTLYRVLLATGSDWYRRKFLRNILQVTKIVFTICNRFSLPIRSISPHCQHTCEHIFADKHRVSTLSFSRSIIVYVQWTYVDNNHLKHRAETWIYVLLWLAAGALIYSFYGRTHSLLQSRVPHPDHSHSEVSWYMHHLLLTPLTLSQSHCCRSSSQTLHRRMMQCCCLRMFRGCISIVYVV